MTGSRTWSIGVATAIAAVIVVGASRPAFAQKPKSYDEQYQAYLEAARTSTSAPRMWMADIATDNSAKRLNDLVTVRVEEAVSASGAADVSIAKKSSGSASFPTPISTYLSKLLPASTDTKASGSGSTSRTTSLTAMMTTRVKEVLPNGDFVVEGVREIDINGDRQLVVLSGVIRKLDILPGNIIPSSRIGQLQIRCLSQGVMKDSLTPGWLIRILNKVF